MNRYCSERAQSLLRECTELAQSVYTACTEHAYSLHAGRGPRAISDGGMRSKRDGVVVGGGGVAVLSKEVFGHFWAVLKKTFGWPKFIQYIHNSQLSLLRSIVCISQCVPYLPVASVCSSC